MWPHRKKSQGFKSGEGGGHGISFKQFSWCTGFFKIYFHLTFCLEEKQDIRKNSMLSRNCL
jgi:hypothetical protein